MWIWLLIVSYWTTNQKTFLVQILIYKNRMVKRIIREDKKRDQEETQDCQRSTPSILDPKQSEQPSDFTKVPHFRDISVILLALFLSRYIFFFLPWKQTSFACYLLSHKRVSIKTIFLLFVNGFSLFFELLDNLAIHITWPSEEDLAELCQPTFVDLSNTAWAWINLTSTVTRSHTTWVSVTSIGSHQHDLIIYISLFIYIYIYIYMCVCVCVCVCVYHLSHRSAIKQYLMTKHNKDIDKLKALEIRKILINNTKTIRKNNNKNCLQTLEAITMKT